MFDVLEFLDENDNLAIFFGDEVMVRSQNKICLLCLFKFGIRETRTCRPSFNLKFAGRSLQATAPDLMMKLVFNLRYNLHIYWRWRFGIMMQSRLRPQWQELEPWVLFYPKVDSLLPGNVYHN